MTGQTRSLLSFFASASDTTANFELHPRQAIFNKLELRRRAS
jgi:hypothetical protein